LSEKEREKTTPGEEEEGFSKRWSKKGYNLRNQGGAGSRSKKTRKLSDKGKARQSAEAGGQVK